MALFGSMTLTELYQETIPLPRAVRFPVELRPPDGFVPERLETWPWLPGRVEFVGGRLLYMPPCADTQQYTVTDVVITLGAWTRSRSGFVLGTNEAGMRLLGAVRAADAAIWRREQVGRFSGKLQTVPPVLAVEVSGEDESEAALREKALWYLSAGVQAVWLVNPEQREVLVLSRGAEQRCRLGERLPPCPDLPDLAPLVDELFTQILSR
jgi:Uma2 family endonuclease